jgi:histidinol dehydrogenase
VRIVYGAEEARRTVLCRRPLGEIDLPAAVRGRIREVFGAELSAQAVAERIVADVRAEGDAAVRRYSRAFDGVEYASLEVPRADVGDAYRQVDPSLVEALRFAADRIRAFHEAQRRHGPGDFFEDGLGIQVRPLGRVGAYVPGTAVVYPSSVLMTVIPARVAGVDQVYIASPASADGRVSPLKLVAADIAGVDRVFRASGAQAVAALAYGTETVPRVDKVCGPGNIFVTLAKKLVYGDVGIDSLYGPTETVVVADDTADPASCAADLLAQAEHDELATPLFLTPSGAVAQAVAAEVERQLHSLERADVARTAIESRGGIVVTADLEEALELANEFGPEHLCLLVRDAASWAPHVRNAGGLFLGETSPEAVGDYTAGPSHVMPAGGSARFSSPLGVFDFLKFTSVVDIDAATLGRLGPPAAAIARAEGLTAHARAIERRLERD